MNKKQSFLALLFSIAAIGVFAYVLYQAKGGLTLLWSTPQAALRLVFLLLLMALARSLPIPMRGGESISLAFAPALFATFLLGAYPAILLYFLSTFFCFYRDPVDYRYRWALAYPPSRVLGNTGIMLTALYAAHFAMPNPGAVLLHFTFPDSLIPLGIYVALVLVIITGSIAIFNLLENKGDARVALTPSTQLPGILLAAFLGFGMAYLADVSVGHEIPLSLPGSLNWQLSPGLTLIPLATFPLLLIRHAVVSLQRNAKFLQAELTGIADASEENDPYLQGHSRRVLRYATEIASDMGLSARNIEQIQTAALLHDIGKLYVSDDIMQKTTPLSEEELQLIQEHSLSGLKLMEGLPLKELVKTMVLHHHERYDGLGYPQKVRLEHLPVEVSILAVAEAYDAMTSKRPYREAMSGEKALSVFSEESGRQFHPQVVYTLQSRPALLESKE